jgi:hypothetical protein
MRGGAARFPAPRALVAAFAFVGYLALALVVRNLYPLSTFEMYAEAPPSRAPSRIIARDAAGAVHEIDEYVGWRCEGEAPSVGESCLGEWPFSTTEYLDRTAAAWVSAHGGAGGGEPVDVVRRIYRLSDVVGPPVTRDCLLRRCRAGRR